MTSHEDIKSILHVLSVLGMIGIPFDTEWEMKEYQTKECKEYTIYIQ